MERWLSASSFKSLRRRPMRRTFSMWRARGGGERRNFQAVVVSTSAASREFKRRQVFLFSDQVAAPSPQQQIGQAFIGFSSFIKRALGRERPGGKFCCFI